MVDNKFKDLRILINLDNLKIQIQTKVEWILNNLTHHWDIHNKEVKMYSLKGNSVTTAKSLDMLQKIADIWINHNNHLVAVNLEVVEIVHSVVNQTQITPLKDVSRIHKILITL